MIRYKDFKPSYFDQKGLNLEDNQDWWVAPVTITRDADYLERSNFDSFHQKLQESFPDEEEWELHEFGHWACGWFRILILKDGSKAQLLGEHVEEQLDVYPVLDEHLCSLYEHEELRGDEEE